MSRQDTKILAHFIWINDEAPPPLYQQCINSFVKIHPFWKIKIWNKKDIDIVISESKYDFNRYQSFINRYNFIKYHILAKEGGWFVDMDIQWKLPIDQIYTDKLKNKSFPDLFVPVRDIPGATKTNTKSNDDMLIYSRPGLFYELLELINNREDIDESRKYEPYGPVSLSKWIHSNNYTREYLYESEIQVDGYYCNHLNGQSWRFY